MRNTIFRLLATFLILIGISCAFAQSKQQFRVESFELDQFDMTARNEAFKEVDGNGSLYAIIKVTSSTPNDDLSAYNFNFGNMNSKVKMKDGELWVYVQRNAKMVTISRNGYETINKYDLQTTIEAGKTYTMRLSTQAKKMQLQMVLFKVSPANCNAVIMVKAETGNQLEQMLGTVDASGQKPKNLEYGSYTYKIIAENYYLSEGRFTLSDQSQTHIETVELRPQFSEITLTVSSNADIYVNNELKGQRIWKGPLNAGTYQVECRQQNHKPTLQTIVVEENKPQTITLQAPTPITGILSVISEPLGATITIDGKNYGQTPRNISDLLIGRHQVKLSLTGYEDLTQAVEIQENNLTETNLAMNKLPEKPSNPGEQTFTVSGNGKTVTFKMKKVEAGSFQMGSNSGDSDEKPVHRVTISKDYYLGETEVTQDLWVAVMGNNPSNFKGSTNPVECVSYNDCQVFIRKLNQKTGKNFRLPTEAEWEYAARGGNKSRGYKYAGSDNIEEVAWFIANSRSTTHPVAQKQPNELGLYDMIGNVWEWCYDWYGSYSLYNQTDPTGISSGSYRVNRGSSWHISAENCRSAIRFNLTPSSRFDDIGFRLALSGYDDHTRTITGKEGETQETKLVLNVAQMSSTTSSSVINSGSTSDGSQDQNIKTFTVTGNGKTVTIKMIKVEAGSFQMGSTSGIMDETPVHRVSISRDFYMAETEVTQNLWEIVMGNNPSRTKGDNLPVSNVSYEDCQTFIMRLNEKVSVKFRLPTEAEWEYAARGGRKSQKSMYAGSDYLGDVGWYADNSANKAHQVSQKYPNELGLYDLSGNVWEWCLDWYGSYQDKDQINPLGASFGDRRVVRGGCWVDEPWKCRVTFRSKLLPSTSGSYIGFRLAL